MSTENVYYYYRGKQEVLKAVLADGLATHEAVLQEAAAHPGTAQEKLHYLLEQYLAFCHKQGRILCRVDLYSGTQRRRLPGRVGL